MARKAGPGHGAEDAPEGRADLTPEEGGFVPDARIPEEPAAGAGLHPSEVGQDARIEALSEEGTSALPEEPDPVTDGSRLFDGPDPSREDAALAAVPEDWRQVAPSGGAAPSWTSAQTDASEATSALPESANSGTDPWQREERASSEPLVLTSSVDPGGDTGQSSAFTSGSPTSEPLAASLPSLAPPRRRGGFGTLLLGGMIAAALGFGAAWLAQDRLGLFPARLPADLDERLAALEARPVPDAADAEGLADRLAEVETRLSALEQTPAATVGEAPVAEAAPVVDIEPLREELSQGIEEAQARVGELEERIATLEARPVAPTGSEAPLGAITPEAGPAVQAAPTPDAPAPDLDGLRQDILAGIEPRLGQSEAGLAEVRTALSEAQASLDALEGRLDQAEAQSAAAAQEAQTAAASLAEAQARAAAAETEARSRVTLGEVEAALAAGQPLDTLASDLAATGVAVPDALSQAAAEGVPTLADLREGFPEAARSGLAVAREQGLLDDGSGMLGFLRGQLSVRSVAPREGGDPDAVLSRAEAQLDEGHVDAALAEVESLPEPVREAMADWIAQARSRVQADAALAELRNALPAPDAPPAN